MLFSIILPIYNVEGYLKQCIESILNQTFQDYEIILVDDGSTDNSPFICDQFAKIDSRIKVLHRKNGGQADARNAGTKEAQGEYIVYIDSDDFVLTNDFLNKIALKTAKMPDIIMYKYQKYFDFSGQLEDCRFSYKKAIEAKDYISQIGLLVEADAFYGMAWIKAIKRSVIATNNIEFDINLVCEDMDWNYNLITNSRSMELIDESFIAYRQREGSVTSTLKLKNLTDFIYTLEKWSTEIEHKENAELKEILYGTLAKYYSNLLVVYSRIRDKQKVAYKRQIMELAWLLNYSMNNRPRKIKKVYQIFGFDLTILILKIIDRIK